MIRAGIYARINADHDGDTLGVGRQLKDCRQLCVDRGWTVVGEYVDNNVSATAARAVRPEYRRLLQAISDRLVDAVVVYDLDRLTRRPIELEEFVNTCASAGVTQLTFVGGGVDLGTGDGLLVARIKGAFAAEEARKASQRGKRKKLELAERGLPSGGGFRPFGFEPNQITHNSEEADLVREASDRVLRGDSMTGIVSDWKRRGLRTTAGGAWTITTLKKVLCSPRTAGLREHKGQVVGEAVWDALLDFQTWDQVVTILNDPSHRQTKARLGYPLRGILRCGECGVLMASRLKQGVNGKMRGYRCRVSSGGCGRVHVTGPPLEKYVFDQVLSLVAIPQLRNSVASQGSGGSALVQEWVVQNSEDEGTLRHLDDGFSDHRIGRTAWLHQRQRIEARIVERTSKLAEHQGWSELDRLGRDPRTVWETMSADDKRTVCHTFIASIRVHRRRSAPASQQFNPERVTVTWRSDEIRAALVSAGA